MNAASAEVRLRYWALLVAVLALAWLLYVALVPQWTVVGWRWNW